MLFGIIMETLRVQVDKKKGELVRKKAMEIYGHSKGSISKAANAALDKWLFTVEGKKGKLKIEPKELTGILSDLKGSSLSLQKKAVKAFGKAD